MVDLFAVVCLLSSRHPHTPTDDPSQLRLNLESKLFMLDNDNRTEFLESCEDFLSNHLSQSIRPIPPRPNASGSEMDRVYDLTCQDSLVRLLLNIETLQTPIATSLLEQLINLASDDSEPTQFAVFSPFSNAFWLTERPSKSF
jgi:hypothetical protein